MNQSLSPDIAAVMPAALATGLFVSLCTIQSPDDTIGPSGQPSTSYTDVSGYVDIVCMDAVLNPNTVLASEAKGLADIMARGFRHVALDGYYPQLLTAAGKGWRAVVDGVAYDLLGVEPDSQSTQTRLQLQLATI